MNEPSGKSIAPCAAAPVATVLPALSDSPAVAGLPSTVIGWLITTRVAGAVTAAEAWTTKNHQPPPTIRSTTRSRTTRLLPQPKPQPRPRQPPFFGATGWVAGVEGMGGG